MNQSVITFLVQLTFVLFFQITPGKTSLNKSYIVSAMFG